jgi:sigma-E factor negative regulatory protein RseA
MTPQTPPAATGGESGDDASRQGLSALLDGQALAGDAQAVQRACALWRESRQARQDWHAWHLIGDVMRSEELARPPARDAAFLARLRERLADEPVVLAPLPVPPPVSPPGVPGARTAAQGARPAWSLPGAVAAGFVLVAGVLVVARMAPPSAAPVLATAPGPGLSAVAVTGAAASSSPGSPALLRDPRLDSYLRAHQSARGSMTAAVPGGGMRNVEATLVPGAGR